MYDDADTVLSLWYFHTILEDITFKAVNIILSI